MIKCSRHGLQSKQLTNSVARGSSIDIDRRQLRINSRSILIIEVDVLPRC